MLIEFRVNNYRSFREPQTLSMVAETFSEHLKSNTFDPELKGFKERLLRSAAIYGANAAGKTNILRALQFMQAWVLNSANPTWGGQYNPYQFSSSTRNAPSEFEVTFAQNGIRYEYGFVIGENQVEEEWLVEFVNSRGRTMYERTYDKKVKKYEWKFSEFLKGQRSLWSNSTRPNSLFLSIAYQLNSIQLMPVFAWFQKRLVIVTGITSLNAYLTLNLLKEKEGKNELLAFMQEADFGITDIDTQREPIPAGFFQGNPIIEANPGEQPKIVKVTLSHWSDDDKHAGLDLSEESNGTQTFFKTAGAWVNVFKNGEVLLVDEIESSLHPRLVRFLVKRFHSTKNNRQNSQLIVTTQNTVLLDQKLLRRDQIWFVEKDKVAGSKIYPLTDFKPRNDEVLENWYLRGRYGALPVLNEVD